ncbi:exodeoxyribonuclease VII small subunit [Sinimarinibacterium thermocellulolyticum]|uniref:Exodeoxyribonuclease 7 small subunit n=1 Tax=Sinimarinibacterium thermocellulolyticum TaxID=3170016 RepID=A0ABV2AAZ7_9GAMM
MSHESDPARLPDGDPVGRFEEAMKELEGIVQSLERGELRLETSLRLFQRGIELTRECRSALDNAELQVRTLLQAEPPSDGAP